MTDKLRKLLANVNNINDIYRILINIPADYGNTMFDKCSRRENPRKFVSLSEVFVRDNQLRPEVIQTVSDGYKQIYKVNGYAI